MTRRSRLRAVASTSAAAALLAGAACEPPPEPAQAAIYSMVLAEARDRLHLETPLNLHPLLAMLELDGGPGEISLLRFNDFDTTAVRTIADGEPAAYRLCSPGAAGGCPVPPGGTALILSDILDLHENGLAVVLVLSDRRPDADFLQYWGARLKPGIRTWSVVEFRRLGR